MSYYPYYPYSYLYPYSRYFCPHLDIITHITHTITPIPMKVPSVDHGSRLTSLNLDFAGPASKLISLLIAPWEGQESKQK